MFALREAFKFYFAKWEEIEEVRYIKNEVARTKMKNVPLSPIEKVALDIPHGLWGAATVHFTADSLPGRPFCIGNVR